MLQPTDVYPSRAAAIAAAMLACSSGPAFAQAVVGGNSTNTVQLDNLPNPNGGQAATVLAGATVNASGGPALLGQNRTWQVDNNGSLTSTNANSFAVQLQNGNQLTNRPPHATNNPIHAGGAGHAAAV